jgi:signal peptide peptidase SppA
MRYGHIIEAVYGKPWAIRPEILAVIVDMLHFRSEGGRLTAEEIGARIEAVGPKAHQSAPPADGVALLQLFGIIAPRASLLAETSTGGTGLDQFMGGFRTALADPAIKSIVIEIDSPGGQVDGLPEAAAEIRAARSQKPVIAVANGTAASAAYWIGSAASEFVCTPSGWVGSIGVRGAHEDLSAQLEQKGVKVTEISAGKYKTEGSPYGPLTDEARAYQQAIADAYYAMFLGDVAKGRNVPVDTVRSDYGEGRMLLAKDAKRAGMIDRIDTLDGVVRRELARPNGAARPAAIFLGPDWSGNGTSNAAFASVADVRAAEGLPPLVAGPIARHKTATVDGTWDGPANEARLPSKEGPLRASHAWVDSAGDPNVKASYKFIHHEVAEDGSVGAANTVACSTGCGVLNGGRGGTTIPAGDKPGVHAHLAGHLTDAGRQAPDMMSEAEGFALEVEMHRRRVTAR